MKQLLTIVLLTIFCNLEILGQTGITNAADIKVRQCSGLKCPVVGKLERGVKCEIISYGKIERIDGYGKYSWLKIKTDNLEGYVFGGLINVEFKNNDEIIVNKTGYLRDEEVNVRICPDLKECPVLTQIPKGAYVQIHSKTKQVVELKSLGKHPWYFIEIGNVKGYVFGGLVRFEKNKLTIDSSYVNIYDTPDIDLGKQVDIANKGDQYTIVKQSPESELIRPYGRNYWYQIKNDNSKESLGWIYGVFTSKYKKADVDCQCVDYVKKILSITGPTKNAFEWDEVLKGDISLTIKGEESFLDYQEITDINKAQPNDIVIFDKRHSEADNQYGHIGIFKKIIKKNNEIRILIEGGNHQVPLKYFYSKNGCSNVSKKIYKHNQFVRIFREKKE